MAWEASRPVPWRRLVREWLIYVAIMAVIFVVLFRDDSLFGVFAGLLASGPLYLLFGYVLAKLGYQRRTLSQARSDTRAGSGSADAAAGGTSAPARPRPAPTRRTGGATAPRPGGKRRR